MLEIALGGAQLYDTAYPGICDPMPHWEVTWNPPDCNGLDGSNTDDVRGLMPPVAWAHAPHGQPVEAAAAPPLLAVDTATRPTPGAFLLCAEALCLGAASASSKMLRGECSPDEWECCFRTESMAAANSVSPIGGFILREQVFGQRQ